MTMSMLVQNLIVAAAVLTAAVWLIRDVRRRRAAKAGCDKCALMRPPPARR